MATQTGGSRGDGALWEIWWELALSDICHLCPGQEGPLLPSLEQSSLLLLPSLQPCWGTPSHSRVSFCPSNEPALTATPAWSQPCELRSHQPVPRPLVWMSSCPIPQTDSSQEGFALWPRPPRKDTEASRQGQDGSGDTVYRGTQQALHPDLGNLGQLKDT